MPTRKTAHKTEHHSTQGRRRRSPLSTRRSSSSHESVLDTINPNQVDYRKVLRNVSQNSPLMLLAGGLGAFVIGRFFYRYYQDHPEISDFIRDNMDTVESRIREFREGSREEMRH